MNDNNKYNYLEIELRYFKKVVKSFGSFILKTIRYVQHRIIFISSVLAIAVLTAFFMYYLTKPYYEHHLVLVSPLVEDNVIVEITNNLNILIDTKNKDLLQNKLDLLPEEANSVIGIEANEKLKYNSVTRKYLNLNRIHVKLTLATDIYGSAISKKIISYYKENDYIKLNYESKNKQLLRSIELLKGNIETLRRESSEEIIAPKSTDMDNNSIDYSIQDEINIINSKIIEFEIQQSELKNIIIIMDSYTLKLRMSLASYILLYSKYAILIIIIGLLLFEYIIKRRKE